MAVWHARSPSRLADAYARRGDADREREHRLRADEIRRAAGLPDEPRPEPAIQPAG